MVEAILAHLLELEARVVVEQVMVELLELPTQAVAEAVQVIVLLAKLVALVSLSSKKPQDLP